MRVPRRVCDARHLHRHCFWLAAWLAACCCLSAQQTPSEPATLRIRKTVRLVEIDVIAKDKHGKPIRGLEAKDFILLDDGKVQKISRLTVQEGTPEVSDPRLGPASNATSRHTPIFSNTHPDNVAATVILFDVLNTSLDDQPAMKKQLLAALTRLKTGTPVSFLILGEDLTVVSDFTTSTISLAEAADDRFGIRPDGFGPVITARATGNPVLDRMIFKTITKVFHADENQRAVKTLAALNLIGQQFARIRGRKSLLWLTGGFRVTDESPSVQNVIDKLNDADVAVYTVDARGVLLDPGITAETDANDLAEPAAEDRELVRGDVLAVIAKSTGGVFYHNTNRLDSAISQAMEDRSLVYAVDYYPQHNDWRGQFHKLVLKTTRAGVHLRYRSGYLATPPIQPSPQDQQQMLAAVAASAMDFSGIRFSVEANAERDPSSQRLTLNIPAEELQWSPLDQKMAAALQIWFIQRRQSGEDIATTTTKSDMQLPMDAYKAATEEGIRFSSSVQLQPAAAKVRVLVRDTNSGRVGTVDVPVNLKSESAPTR